LSSVGQRAPLNYFAYFIIFFVETFIAQQLKEIDELYTAGKIL
jgi:hypothetical protein